ncbi:hypothetical protein BLOT_015025 [Blomia tropicalis]|nr:hypothetical protein BLOT_015025 [Blomia tropicalis]
MSKNSGNKIPRIELTRERSSTLDSIQSLTRAIRESLRMHSVRREKKRRLKKAAKGCNDGTFLDVKDTGRRNRSKSMDHVIDEGRDDSNQEISEAAVSAVIVSDVGPAINCNTPDILTHQVKADVIDVIESSNKNEMDDVFEDAANEDNVDNNEQQQQQSTSAPCEVAVHERRHSKSLNETELATICTVNDQSAANLRKMKTPQMSLDLIDNDRSNKQPARQSSMPTGDRSTSNTNDEAKVDASVLRKRFARLLDTLRSHKFSMASLEESTNTLKPDSSN